MSEVAVGVQFPAVLNPVHLGLYYQRTKARFPKIQVQPPLTPSFETFGGPQIMSFGVVMPPVGLQPRMWFMSADENSLIQLQGDRLLFNWRGGVQGSPYPHFETVYAEFTNALDELETLAAAEGITAIAADVNQCEVLYVNPLLTANTGVPLSAPEKIFRVWSDKLGVEWQEPLEDMSFTLRYRLNGEDGKPFGMLGKVTLGRIITSSVAVTSWNPDQGTLGSQRQSLSQQPLTALALEEPLRVKIEQFREALRDALELSDTMIADEAGDPIDNQTMIYAIQSLEPLFMSLNLPPPLVLPLQNGGIGTEWHTSGMNIELRFRKPYDVYAVLEDAQGAVPPYHGRDPHLVQSRSALCELSARSAG